MHTAGLLEKQSTKWWDIEKPGGLPSLAPNHPQCQECQLRERRKEGGKEGVKLGKCDWCKGQGEEKGVVGRGKEGQKGDRREERKTSVSAIAKHPLYSCTVTRKKRVDLFKGQNARTGFRGGNGGGYYKNVKRALQPFSRRSAGGH